MEVLVSFDHGLATALGFAPTVLHYTLLALTSVTAVGAFDAVGAVLVVVLQPTSSREKRTMIHAALA